MNDIKCIHKRVKGGCTQINPRYDRLYKRCNQITCLGNPANSKINKDKSNNNNMNEGMK